MHCFAYSFTSQRYSIIGCHRNPEGFTLTSTFRALLPLAEDLSTASFAEGDARASSTRARIEFLRLAIIRNRDVAKSCDADFRNQLLILANEMEDHLRVLVVTLPESRAE